MSGLEEEEDLVSDLEELLSDSGSDFFLKS
jgi:hypothetical protein